VDLVLLKTKIEDARKRVGAAERELESDLRQLTDNNGGEKTVVAKLLEHAFATLREARRHLADLNELLAAQTAPDRPAERSCPACGATIRADARLCGYCWLKLV
jgi:peptidoglycan hydrolase CwlO-like protein